MDLEVNQNFAGVFIYLRPHPEKLSILPLIPVCLLGCQGNKNIGHRFVLIAVIAG